MFRRSAQHPAQHPASRHDEYPTLEPAWGHDEYPTQDPSWYRDEYPAERPVSRQAQRPAARRADHPTQEFSAWGQDEQPAARRAEPPASRWPQRPAARPREYPTQDFAWGQDEYPGERPASRRARRPAFHEDEYPTQHSAWDQDETQDAAWGQDEHFAWDHDEHAAARQAQDPAGRQAGYKKPTQPEANRRVGPAGPVAPAGPARHRKPSLMRSAFRRRSVWMTTAVVVAAAAGLVVGQKTHWPDLTSQPAALNRATPSGPGSVGHSPAATPGRSPATGSGQPRNGRTGADGDRHSARRRTTGRRPDRRKHGIFAYYRNPLRSISGLLPERIDMGVDFGGSGKIYAIGKGVVVSAVTGTAGWPGGGWMSYRLTSGPAKGLMVYVAEDITPTVTVGQTVRASTVIANMFNGGAGIETGWAQSNAVNPESQAPEAGGIWGQGPFPTAIGMNFEELLQALGVPAGYGRNQSTFGTLPAGYPTSW